MIEETDEGAPRQMLDVDKVLKLVPISVRTLARMEVRGTFPPGRLVAGRKLWFADEVARWQQNLDVRQGRTRPARAEVA